MSNNNPLPTELDWEEELEVARVVGILRALSKKESDDRTPEEKWWDELEEYNPFFSRYVWRGEVKGQPANKDPEALFAELSLGS